MATSLPHTLFICVAYGLLFGEAWGFPVKRKMRGIWQESTRYESAIFSSAKLQRRNLLVGGAALLPSISTMAFAFEGGVGGLGKTKPATGIVYWNEPPVQILSKNAPAEVFAELSVAKRPVRVSFCSPWPLLQTGFETRNMQTAESAFVQVVEQYKTPIKTEKAVLDLLQATVLSSLGKFGAYGDPVDVKLKNLVVTSDNDITCGILFTTFTPGLRESERRLAIRAIRAFDTNWILLVAGTTRQGYRPETFETILESFMVVPAPVSR